MKPPAGTEIPFPVTRQHIDGGAPGQACECAVALAILDALRVSDLTPAADSVSVVPADDGPHVNVRAWITPGDWLRLTLGEDGYRFLEAFDAGQPVQPCTLTAAVA